MLPYILQFRLDFAALAVLAVVATWWCQRLVRQRRPAEPLPVWIGLALAVVLLAGGFLAEWSGAQRRARLVSMFSAFAPTYAYELQRLGHARVGLGTARDDSTYFRIIEAQKNWLRVNPLIADIYTFRYDSDHRVRMIVDSETDYDHDGKIEGEREERTRIGEVYAEATEDFHGALRGEARFDVTLVPDRWGVWVSSLAPIYDDHRRVEAAVGLDYPAGDWLTVILSSRAVSLAGTAVLIAVMLTSATVGVLMRGEIRERKAAQEQLRRDKEAVDLLSRAKTEFIGVMTHEIRSPLTALMGYTGLLLEMPLPPVQERYARTIAKAGERLVVMLNDILDLTKLEAGRLEVESAPFLPGALMNEIADTVTARAMEKGLTLDFEPAMPDELLIVADATRLRQVVASLLSNAIKFTDRGTVTLRARWEPSDEQHGHLHVEVSDTGAGIPAHRLPHVFDLYSGSGRGSGGAGLALCRRLIELMGGTISASSAPGSGARFSCSLPCTVASPSTVPPPAEFDLPRPLPGDAPALLFINPDPLRRDIVNAVLTRNGYRVEGVGMINDAVSAIQRTKFDAILIDVEDSNLEAAAVAAALREAGQARHRVPIIAVAASPKASRDRYREAGIDECLTKPMYMPAVLSVLEAFVRSGENTPPR